MIKRWTTILLCLILVVSFSACGNKKQANDSANVEKESSVPTPTLEPTTTPEEKKLSVSVSFDAMKELVAAVGKDKVEIVAVIPAGTETHDFEPKAQDLVNLSAADIFVYNGLGMEGWAEEAIAAADNTDLIVIEASNGAVVIENETSDDHDDDHDDGHDDDHDDGHDDNHDDGHDDDHDDGHSHGKYDPHLWLSLKGAQTMITNIRDGLIQADPSNKDYYEQNHNEFAAQLEALYQDYSEKFQSVEKKNFVTGHAAFGYLCRDFGLEQNSIRNMFAEGEPSAKQLAELVEYCREHNVTTIFSENPQDGMTYLERMESNLSKIYASLTN